MGYAETAGENASLLIEKKGIALTLRVPGVVTKDPAMPWRGTGVGAPTDYPTKGALFDYNARMLDGTSIRAEDKKCLIAGPAVAIKPQVGYLILQGSVFWRIEHVDELAPNGVPILYTLQLRKGPTDDAFDGEGERRDVNFN